MLLSMTDRRLGLRTLVGLVAALGLFATSCGGGSAETTTEAMAESTSAAASAPTPDAVESAEASLVATTVDGAQIDFGSLEGQDVVLWFWAPW